MFHLFNSVKVLPDFALDSYFGMGRVYAISAFQDNEYCNTDIFKQVLAQRAILVANSYEDLVGTDKKFKDDLDFFKGLYNETKYTNMFNVMADAKTYAVIVSKFIKLFFPQCNAYQAFAQYKLSLDWFYVLYNYTNPNDDVSVQGRCYGLMTRYDEDAFIDIFTNTTVVFDEEEYLAFKDSIKDYLSVEYQVASVLASETLFENRIRNIFRKRILGKALNSVYEYVEGGLYNLYADISYDKPIEDAISSNETINYIANKIDKLKADVPTNDILLAVSVLKEAVSSDESDVVDAEIEKYMQNVSDNATKSFLRQLLTIQVQHLDTYTCCDLVGRLNDMSAKELVEYSLESSRKWYNTEYSFDKSRLSINIYLLHHVYNTYKQNVDNLTQFKIR